jgi:hypothetical protein
VQTSGLLPKNPPHPQTGCQKPSRHCILRLTAHNYVELYTPYLYVPSTLSIQGWREYAYRYRLSSRIIAKTA